MDIFVVILVVCGICCGSLCDLIPHFFVNQWGARLSIGLIFIQIVDTVLKLDLDYCRFQAASSRRK